ncbi:hypothetical protein ABPG74_018160 [Tetrahymena malaccensis]
MNQYPQNYEESPSFQDSFIDQQQQIKSNLSLHTLQPNDTFHAEYQTQNHPSFQEKNLFINQLNANEYSHDNFEVDQGIGEQDYQNNDDVDENQTRNYTINYNRIENNQDEDEEIYTDYLPENFFEQLKPNPSQFNMNYNQNAQKKEERKSVNNRSTSLKKRMEQKNNEMLYTRAAKQQICQNLVQQQIDKEIKYMSNAKKMSQNSYRIVAKKLENEISAKMAEVDPSLSKILTFSQVGRLFQLLNLFTVVKFDENSQIIIEQNIDPHKKLRFAQETMFHQQFWFFVVNYINKETVLGEIVFSTLRILMDPMQLTIKETKDFLAQYMGRTLTYLEEDRKAAQERTQGFQLWSVDEIIKAFRQINEQRILREKSQNINNPNNNGNKRQASNKDLDKNVYTFKPTIDKNSQLIDEMHRKKFAMTSSGLNITPIRHSNATQNTKSIQSTNKLINLLQSSQSNQNLHSQASILIQQPINQAQINNNHITSSNLNNHSSSTLSFLNNQGNQHSHINYNESNSTTTNATSDYRNTDVANNSSENSQRNSDRFLSQKVKSLLSQHQHPSRSNLNASSQNFNTLQHNSHNNNHNGLVGMSEYDHEDPQSYFSKIKRCATLSSFQIPEEDYIEDISHIPSNNFEKPIDRVNMMLQKQQQTQRKISQKKEQIIQEQMKECTFKPQLQRSVSPQYSAYSRNQNELIQRQQHDINKRQQAAAQRNQQKQEYEDKLLNECTFQPSLSPSQRNFNKISKSPVSPKGFEQTVHRMRAAQDIQRQSRKAFDQGSYSSNAQILRNSLSPLSVEVKKQIQQHQQLQQSFQKQNPPQQKTQYLQQKDQQKEIEQHQSSDLEEENMMQQQPQQQKQQFFQKNENQNQNQNKKQLHQQNQSTADKENEQSQDQENEFLNDQYRFEEQTIDKQKPSFQDQTFGDSQKKNQQFEINQKPKAKPFFVLDIITPKGEKAALELFKDDDIYQKAEQFTQQYSLDEITQSKIEQILDQQMQKYLQKRQNTVKNN